MPAQHMSPTTRPTTSRKTLVEKVLLAASFVFVLLVLLSGG